MGTDLNWRGQSACLHTDPDLFFPIGTTGPALLQIAQAKKICAGCPVLGECLAWVRDHPQEGGVWAGMSHDERHRDRRRRLRRAAAARKKEALVAEAAAQAEVETQTGELVSV